MNNPNPLPLAVAVCDGDIQRVEALLDENEPINKRDYKGRTALVLALLSMEMDIARLLLERGADPNLHDAKGRLPLNLALQLPDLELVEMLMDRGARLDAADRKGLAPLHLAAARGCAGIVARLMERGASLDARDGAGSTPLHLAAANNRLEATRALLLRKPELEIRNDAEQTPLLVAVKAGANGVVKLLLDQGADPHAHTRFGTTPLDLAYRERNYEVVGLIEGVEALERIDQGLAGATEHLISETYCEALERRLELLRENISHTNRPRFNVNRFLEVFDKIRLEDDHVLDYYHNHLDEPLESPESSDQEADGGGEPRRSLRSFLDLDDLPDRPRRHVSDPNAQPYVFTRSMDADRAEALRRARDQYWRRSHLLEHLSYERSPEGLLQWVVFRTAITQFHLCWHANYNDLRFILSRDGLERVLKTIPAARTEIVPYRRYSLEQLSHGAPLTEPDRDKVRAVNLAPWIKVAGDLGEARVFTFTKWGGFAWRHYRLRWPHHVDRVKIECVAKYNCGIQY